MIALNSNLFKNNLISSVSNSERQIHPLRGTTCPSGLCPCWVESWNKTANSNNYRNAWAINTMERINRVPQIFKNANGKTYWWKKEARKPFWGCNTSVETWGEWGKSSYEEEQQHLLSLTTSSRKTDSGAELGRSTKPSISIWGAKDRFPGLIFRSGAETTVPRSSKFMSGYLLVIWE